MTGSDRALEAPGRPALAPGVQLVGQLAGSGFEERQWLVQRNGHFIQLTELLYRIAANADGQRSLEEIAARVTEETEWLVTPEDVRRMLASRLLPLGLIAPAADGGNGAAAFGDRQGSHSSLAIGMRMKAVGPRVLDPVSDVLQYLFAPVLLVPLLAVAAAAHVWLYTSRRLAAALVDTLHTPGALGIVIGLVLLAAAFHELGHAAALRYGGGRARGMGVGFYFLFPAFYTDVTESYRLGRWGRVRTDLGGVYFHLLFALALIGFALAFDQEYLFVAVPLINFEILRQMIPFVRLDGYWAIADLTGVPDLFSQTGAFLRSVLPRGRAMGNRLPRLKPWVRAVFGGYVVLMIPALAVVLALLVVRLPRMLSAVWDAALTHAALASGAWRNADLLALASIIAGLLVLGLIALGIAYFVYTFTWRPLRAAWRQPYPRRRLIALAAVSGWVALLGVVWTPQLPFAGRVLVPAGVETFQVTDRRHLAGAIAYPMAPPVGGAHAPVWQNCGFYDAPVANENAVHSLEHGAVWIAYRPDLAEDEVGALRRLANEQSHVLVNPFPGLARPVVASAWGRQIALASALDSRLERFVRAFRLHRDAPESGGPCHGGTGRPK
jgi:putative peptide zinc metalloprotease protein